MTSTSSSTKAPRVVVINPPLVSQKGDLFSSGIPYFPIGAAYLSAQLRAKGYEVSVIDAFGQAPKKIRKWKDKFLIQGITTKDIVSSIPVDARFVCVYASLVTTHSVNKEIMSAIKQKRPDLKIVIFENSQQVFAYSLQAVYEELLSSGADYVVVGEPEERVPNVLETALRGEKPTADGVGFISDGKPFYNPKLHFIKDLDLLPFPAFELFPLSKYWSLGYSHGPFSGPYLPILTSRGCPYGCKYCVVPATNARRWRARTAKNVVDEMDYMAKKFGVTDFHWEDLNPTIDKKRMQEISRLIVERGLKVTWKLSAGTKVETFDVETLDWMAKAGCVYVSISPESGSPNILKLMDKPFNHEYGLKMVKRMNELNVKSQACFVLGYTGETDEDRTMTWNYLKELVKAGLDETALFIMTPIPGSNQFPNYSGYEDFAELTFTPMWRSDFKKLQAFRGMLYLKFLYWKLRYQPFKLLGMMGRFLQGKFKVKSEMTLWRVIKTHLLYPMGIG